MEERRVIQNIVLIQDSNYVQQGDRLRVQSTLRKNGPDSSLLWLINVWSGCRGGGFLRFGQLCSEFRCERRGRTVGNSGTFLRGAKTPSYIREPSLQLRRWTSSDDLPIPFQLPTSNARKHSWFLTSGATSLQKMGIVAQVVWEIWPVNKGGPFWKMWILGKGFKS